ncbi:MAG: phospho-N-acetylmuramoyl-pentapeptide-transferase [Erysipelotrichaceae bacterium]|nr:phospho-N-acetylmuramoyl-pentapeptide-transferase [Erysipelotrichaceae bacterium]
MNITLISILGFVLSVVITCIVMPCFIKALKKHNINQSVSEYALDSYKNKDKTPIMGGLIFVVVPIIVYLAINHSSLNDRAMLFIIFSYVLFCLVGFADDLMIILRHNNEGLSPRFKLILEIIIMIVLSFVFKDVLKCTIDIPFINGGVTLSPIIFIPFMILLFLAEANAVNFTDGMDGLCAGVSFIALTVFAIIAYIYKTFDLFILILCVLGGLLGYLFFNFHPAKIFMGDSGSLALGALFSSIAVVLNKEIALFFIGGVFVIEMFCVCLQLTSVKLFHKRVFSYTPIHYAFTLKGMKEVNVVLLFYAVGIILGVIGLFIGLH